MNVGKMVWKYYDFLCEVGTGRYSDVLWVKDKASGSNMIIKAIAKANSKDYMLEDEITALESLRHPDICRLHHYFQINDRMLLFMEFCPGSTLERYITDYDGLQETEAQALLKQIVLVVSDMHDQGFAHCDIRPENIMFNGRTKRIKFIDFGMSCRIGSSRIGDEEQRGSLYYGAPETFQEVGTYYDVAQADVWSIGVLLYKMIANNVPFRIMKSDLEIFSPEDFTRTIQEKIKQGKYTIPRYFSHNARKIVKAMLVVDPDSRISMNELTQHPCIDHTGMNAYFNSSKE